MQRQIRWSLGLLLCWRSLAWAQGLPVYDNTNFLQNIVTAVQTTITAVQTTKTVLNQLLDLEALDDIMTAAAIAEDLEGLSIIVMDAQGLSYDLSVLNTQITALFALETAPDTRQGLDERLGEIRQTAFQARTFALRTQVLISTVFRTVKHLTQLIESIGDFVGAKQGQQTAVQVQGDMATTLAILEAQTAAFQRSETVDRMSKELIMESLTRIQAKQLEDWPR